MKNKVQAIVMGVCAVFFVGGFVVCVVLQVRQSSVRSDLRSDGIEVPVEARSFLEQDARRLSPNTGEFTRYSDDQVLFTFRDSDGREVTGIQPIAEDRYNELGLISELTAVYLAGNPDDAELLQNGDFVANVVPYWIFAAIAGLLALGSAVSAYFSSRPVRAAASANG